MSETIGEARARKAGLARKTCNGPLFLRIFVQKRKGLPDHRITRSPEPAGLFLWQSVYVTAQCFDKKKFGQFGNDHAAAGALCVRLSDRKLNRIGKPLA